jgi:hypothetical protein
MSNCNCICNNNGLQFVFKELNRKTKPFLILASDFCDDAKLLADALNIVKCACGQINGCCFSRIFASINDMLSWRSDASLIPCSDIARVLSYLQCSSNDTGCAECN